MNTDTVSQPKALSITRRITFMIIIPVVVLTLINFTAILGVVNKMRITASIRDDMNEANNILLGKLTQTQSALLFLTSQANRTALQSQAILAGNNTNNAEQSLIQAKSTLTKLRQHTVEIEKLFLEMKYTTPQDLTDEHPQFSKRLKKLKLIWPEKEDDSKAARNLKTNLDQFKNQIASINRELNSLSNTITSDTAAELESTLSQLEPAATTLFDITEYTNEVKTARVFRLLNNSKLTITKAVAGNILLTLVAGIILISLLVFSAKRKITTPLKTLAERINHIEKNADLSSSITLENKDEIGVIANSFNGMLDNFRHIVSQVTTVSDRITSNSQETSQVMETACAILESQKTSTDSITGHVQELLETTKKVSGNTERTANMSQQAQSSTIESQEISSEAVSLIHDLSENVGEAGSVIDKVVEESEQIDQVIDVINSISEQTNLLELNAAIESARAGEAGRGFAVVADEVRVLAKRTQGSTQEIQKIMQGLKQGSVDAAIATQHSISKAEASVNQVKQTAAALEAIAHAVTNINTANEEITESTKTQHVAAHNIHTNMTEITTISEQTNFAAKQALEACHTLLDESEKLRTLVHRFKV